MAVSRERIGRYDLIEEIASGGQGVVYRAFSADDSQIVAIKVLLSHVTADTTFVERFRREALLASSIDHPNVVKIFEVGESDGRHFIAMEFLPESLARLIETAGQLPLNGAVRFAVQIADGLAAAHARGIVHRDMKPQNVLITTDGTAKITDFGIARAESLATVTATGLLMGTPHYMSPEQAGGERADARSDVYAVGCVFYHMLAGQVPHDATTPLAILRMHREDDPAPITDLRDDVPPAIADVIAKSLAKSP
ncbi:MAG: serine/threonine protein kinase, partial [Acidobacteria bacterium]|nr:serine/threonine protein kinase [Acidobacteriota bacterium]